VLTGFHPTALGTFLIMFSALAVLAPRCSAANHRETPLTSFGSESFRSARGRGGWHEKLKTFPRVDRSFMLSQSTESDKLSPPNPKPRLTACQSNGSCYPVDISALLRSAKGDFRVQSASTVTTTDGTRRFMETGRRRGKTFVV
jgi:hypothetical protein